MTSCDICQCIIKGQKFATVDEQFLNSNMQSSAQDTSLEIVVDQQIQNPLILSFFNKTVGSVSVENQIHRKYCD